MKTSTPNFRAAIAAIAFLVVAGGEFALAQCPPSLTFPSSGAPLASDVTIYPNGGGTDSSPSIPSTFMVDVVTAGQALPVGLYQAWCVDGQTGTTFPAVFDTVPGAPVTGKLYATCDPGLNTDLAAYGTHPNTQVSASVWLQVDYVLKLYNENPSAYFYWDVQAAINTLVGSAAGSSVAGCGVLTTPTPDNCGGYPGYSDSHVASLLAAASTAVKGGWMPTCGDVIGVVYVTAADSQFIVIEVPFPCPSCACGTENINYNFNGTQIIFQPTPGGSHVWFTSDGVVNGLPSTPVTLHIYNQVITIPATKTSPVYTVAVPDSFVTFSHSTTVATANFISGAWYIDLPSSGLAGNVFYGGASFAVPAAGLPGGIQNVSWSGKFVTSTPGLTIHWQWHAAAYTDFTSDYTLIDPKPVDDNKASLYQTSDQSGTPEGTNPATSKPWKNYVEGGASGGGGGNYTGSGSSTIQFPPCVCTTP